MSDIGSGAALLLAGVFALAGLVKLRRPATTATFRALRLPAPTLAAVAVPVGELAVAVLLLAVPPVGAALAVAALGAFSLVLTGALRRDEPVSCGCFGNAGDDPVSAADLVRNALLGLAAVVAVTAGTPGLPSFPGVVTVSAAAVAGVVLVAMVRLRALTGRGLLDTSAALGFGPAVDPGAAP